MKSDGSVQRHTMKTQMIRASKQTILMGITVPWGRERRMPTNKREKNYQNIEAVYQQAGWKVWCLPDKFLWRYNAMG
jgi:hypothetical protein